MLENAADGELADKFSYEQVTERKNLIENEEDCDKIADESKSEIAKEEEIDEQDEE